MSNKSKHYYVVKAERTEREKQEEEEEREKLAQSKHATLLKPPTTDFEAKYYVLMGATTTKSGIWFSPVTPLVAGLRSFAEGAAGPGRPKMIIFDESRLLNAFTASELDSMGVEALGKYDHIYVYPSGKVPAMPPILWEFTLEGCNRYRRLLEASED